MDRILKITLIDVPSIINMLVLYSRIERDCERAHRPALVGTRQYIAGVAYGVPTGQSGIAQRKVCLRGRSIAFTPCARVNRKRVKRSPRACNGLFTGCFIFSLSLLQMNAIAMKISTIASQQCFFPLFLFFFFNHQAFVLHMLSHVHFGLHSISILLVAEALFVTDLQMKMMTHYYSKT